MELTSGGDAMVEYRIEIDGSGRLDGGQELSSIALGSGNIAPTRDYGPML